MPYTTISCVSHVVLRIDPLTQWTHACCATKLWEGGDTLEKLNLLDDHAEWEDVP